MHKSICAEHIVDRIKDFLGPVLDEVVSIVVAGGGANLVANHLKAEWEHCETVDDPRFSVAEGMRRMGMGIMANRKAAA